LANYLLAPTHPDGSPKAKFFESFGFSRARPDELRAALIAHAAQYDVVSSRQTEFGEIFEIVGRLNSPDGRNPFVKAVWMIDLGTRTPRLVTAVPARGARP
jgi:hypothetical protein